MTEMGDALAPGTRLDEFEIDRVLGAGGFGVTYLARDLSLDAWRAVKEYLPRDWGDAAEGRDDRAADRGRRRGLRVGPDAVSGGGAYPGAIRPPAPGAGVSGVRGAGHGLHGDRVCGGAGRWRRG